MTVVAADLPESDPCPAVGVPHDRQGTGVAADLPESGPDPTVGDPEIVE